VCSSSDSVSREFEHIQRPPLFLEDETLPSLPSTCWFQEQIRARVQYQTIINLIPCGRLTCISNKLPNVNTQTKQFLVWCKNVRFVFWNIWLTSLSLLPLHNVLAPIRSTVLKLHGYISSYNWNWNQSITCDKQQCVVVRKASDFMLGSVLNR